MVKLILLMLILAHWSGCVQYLVPFLEDFPEGSWVARHGLVVRIAFCTFSIVYIILRVIYGVLIWQLNGKSVYVEDRLTSMIPAI